MDRLAEYFTAENYGIFLNISKAEDKIFSGEVEISGKASRADFIKLHSKDLVINKVSAHYDDEIVVLKHELIPGNDELQINFINAETDKKITFDSDIKIKITFNGEITDAMHGMYPCYYHEDDARKQLIATQFESHHAREVFPCVDEPEAKATFDLTIEYANGQKILANTNSTSEVIGATTTTTFARTPKMSTYLLAFVVGDLQNKTAHTKNGVEVSTWSTKAHGSDMLDFPLGVAIKSLEFYEDYFGVKFPLEKCDHIALPDFSSGAMENWGLITYRETAMLANAKSSLSSKRQIALVIAHETAHQWFGNLVTMKWWDDLWLNESFATMMEYLAVDNIYPDWNIWEEFAVNEAILSLRRDAIDGVQSVHIPVHHPDEIGTIFDGAIVYAKGARLMNMLRNYVGEEAFRSGLANYFEKFAYQNTVGDDLWQALSAASGKDVGGFMNLWLKQPGYPVIEADYSDGKLKLSQSQFFIGEGKDENRVWPILLNSSNPSIPKILGEKSITIDFDLEDEGLIQLNQGNISHFITKYSDNLLEKILSGVESGELDAIARLQLLQEVSLLARGGKISSSELVKVLRVYKNESNLVVWDMISILIGELKIFIDENTETEVNMKRFVRELAHQQFERLGAIERAEDSEDDKQLRPIILAHMLYSEDETAISESLKIYQSAQNISEINAEIRSLIISNKVRVQESAELIDEFIEIYTKTPNADFKNDILTALSSTKNPKTGEKLLNLMKNPQIVRPQDILHWYIYFLRNLKTRNLTWQWLRNNWAWAEETFGGDKSYNDFPRYTGSVLRTPEQMTEFEEFFNPLKSEPSLRRAIEMGEREIAARIKLIERDKIIVERELAKA